jgi:hypothetical protein
MEKIAQEIDDLLFDLAMDAVTKNEIGDFLPLAYKFSDPDGIQTGKSGYSFGRVQFDIENNWIAIECLRACGFRPKDLDRLFEQRGDISDLDRKLSDKSNIVDQYDRSHVESSVHHCATVLGSSGVQLKDTETMIHIIDYHNQFYLSRDGKMHNWLKGRAGEINSKDILYFKLHFTKWGESDHGELDIRRRWVNINNMFSRI